MEKETIMFLDALHQGLTITDAGGRLVYISDSFAEFFGIDKNDAIGRNISYYENTNILKPSITRIVLERKEIVKATQRDAKGRELLVTGVPIYENNRFKYVVCFNSWDFLTLNELKIKYEKLKAENNRLEAELNNLKKAGGLEGRVVSESKIMQDNLRLAEKISDVKIPVYIWGEEGCGKKNFAKAIHKISKWKNEKAEVINCTLFSDKILEGVLFGNGEQRGITEAVGDGMIIIENIEAMPKYLQLELRKCIEHKGVRIAALSHFPIELIYNEGKIIPELFHCLSVININIPPLCERLEDLKKFIEIYMDVYNNKYGRKISLTPKAFSALLKYNWPNNVSQVKFIIERIILTSDVEKVDVYNLPKEISASSYENYEGGFSLKSELEAFEKEIVANAYYKYKTTVAIADYLGISQASAVRKLQKYVEGYKNTGKQKK